jgi:hypothetical protein
MTSVALNTILSRGINPSSLIKKLGILGTSHFCPDISGIPSLAAMLHFSALAFFSDRVLWFSDKSSKF